MNMEDWAYASKFKDLITRVVLDTLNIERPTYTYATVVSVDVVNSTVQVKYREDEDPVTLPAVGALPCVPGQIVKIDGVAGDRHVVAVMKEPGLGEIPSVFHPYFNFDYVDSDLTNYSDYYGLFSDDSHGGYDGIIDIPIWWKSTKIEIMWVPDTNSGGNVEWVFFVYDDDMTTPGVDYSAGVGFQTLNGVGPTLGEGVLQKTSVGETTRHGRLKVRLFRDYSTPFNTHDQMVIFGGILLTRAA